MYKITNAVILDFALQWEFPDIYKEVYNIFSLKMVQAKNQE